MIISKFKIKTNLKLLLRLTSATQSEVWLVPFPQKLTQKSTSSVTGLDYSFLPFSSFSYYSILGVQYAQQQDKLRDSIS